MIMMTMMMMAMMMMMMKMMTMMTMTTETISECDHLRRSGSVRLLSSNVGRASDWQTLYSAVAIPRDYYTTQIL